MNINLNPPFEQLHEQHPHNIRQVPPGLPFRGKGTETRRVTSLKLNEVLVKSIDLLTDIVQKLQ